MTGKQALAVVLTLLIPPALFLLVLAAAGRITLDISWGMVGVVSGAYVGWAAFLAAVAQYAGWLPTVLRGRPREGVPHLEPQPSVRFVGREKYLERLRRLLKPGRGVKIVGLVGMGGIGKTELAKVAVAQVARRFKDGVLWADCGEQELATTADLWAAEYGVQLMGERLAEKAAGWRSVASGREALLVFDNVQPGQAVELLIPGRGRCAVLLTCRQVGHPALEGAERLVVDRFMPPEARALTEKVLERRLAPEEAAEAQKLFELLGYLPLGVAVALGDARENGYSLGYLQKKLVAAGALAVLGSRGTEPEARDEAALRKNLNLTFETAWRNLPPDLRETLGTLALLSGGPSFSTGALAETLALEPEEARGRLRRLAGRSLLTEVGEERWALHILLREFVAGKDAVAEGAPQRMAEHYLRVAERAEALCQQGGEGMLQGLAFFDRDRPHIRAGQAWAAAQAEADEAAARLCSEYPAASVYYLDLRLHPQEWIAWLEAGLRAAQRLGNRKAEGNHLGNLGNAYLSLGEVERAIEFYQQALVIARQIGDRRGEGNSLGNLGNAYLSLGEVERAIEFYQQALVIARQIGDRRGEANRLDGLGLAYADQGELRRAIEYHEQALAISREIGDRRDEGNSLGHLGNAYFRLGEARQAIEFYQQALVIARDIGHRRNEEAWLGNLGNAYLGLGEPRRAIEYHEQALAISREIGDRRGEGNSLGNLGLACTALGEPRRAIEYHEQALTISREIGDRRGEAADLGSLGLAYAALGEARRAIEYHEQGLAIARQIGDRRGEGNSLGNLGLAYANLGEARRAIEFYQQALVIARQIGDRRGEGNHLGNLGGATRPWGRWSKRGSCGPRRCRSLRPSRTPTPRRCGACWQNWTGRQRMRA